MASATTCDHVDQGLTKVWQVGLIAGFMHPLHSLFSSGLPRVAKGVFNIPLHFLHGRS